MARKQALLELQGILNYRSQAMAQGASLHPSMEQSFYAFSKMRPQLELLEGMVEICQEYPEVARMIQFGDEQQQRAA